MTYLSTNAKRKEEYEKMNTYHQHESKKNTKNFLIIFSLGSDRNYDSFKCLGYFLSDQIPFQNTLSLAFRTRTENKI